MEAVFDEDREGICQALADGEVARPRCRFRRILKDGSCIWLGLEAFLLKKEADASWYCGVLRDVTEEHQTSEDLKTSHSALQTIFHYSQEDMDGQRDFMEPNRTEFLSLLPNALPIGMIGGYCEEDFPLYFVRREQYRMMGYDSYQEFETAIQGKVANTIYYKDLERVSRELGSSYHVGMEYTTTYRMPRKDGSLFWVLDKGRVVRAEDGRLPILSSCMDITEIMGQLESLQQNILDMNKIEQSQLVLNREEMRLQEVLDQMTSMFMGQAQAKDLHFEVQGQGSSDQAFYGDSLRLNQILINLLGNAFKFTPGGGCVKLSVEELLSRGGKERVRYRFVVRDSGVGMSPEFLAAEDNALNAEILDELLRMRGVQVDVRENGALAVEAFRTATPGTYDAILMDVQMPVMNGYEAAGAIRAMDRADARTIPIIAMTANAFAEDVQMALESGMDAHAPKPIDIDKVERMLGDLTAGEKQNGLGCKS